VAVKTGSVKTAFERDAHFSEKWTMWYLEPELATKQEVTNYLSQIWHWDCLRVGGWLGSGDKWEQAEALWAEFYAGR